MQFRERYDILKQIGRGTTASVFLVRDKHIDKCMVAKVFDSASAQQFDTGLALQNEMSILKSLNHSHMPRLVDFYQEPSGTFLVMDYIEGATLKYFIEHYGPISEASALTWMLELSQLIGYLHYMSPPVLYCDLKPENIILKPDGQLALVDFGSARSLPSDCQEPICMSGTRGYTAPELFDTEAELEELMHPRADVYSIGAVGLYMTTGMHPVNGPLILGEKIREDGVLTRSFRQLIRQCMEDKIRRIPSVDVLLEEIKKRR